jgi:hypothetical protein
MVEITTAQGKLILEVQGLHKLWALKSQLEIPLEHIVGVQVDPHPAMGWFQAWKIAGTDFPNVFRAGMFWQEGNKVFWDVRHPEKTVVIELKEEFYGKLIVEVDDPDATVQAIETALTDFQAAKAAAERELGETLQPHLGNTDSIPTMVPASEESAQTIIGNS